MTTTHETTDYGKAIGATTALDIHALRALMNANAYEASDGGYSSIPTWGPETERVRALIVSSCADQDIVSWDTRDADVSRHRYLLRVGQPAERRRHRFVVVTEPEMETW